MSILRGRERRFGLALRRAGNGSRSFEELLRQRSTALAPARAAFSQDTQGRTALPARGASRPAARAAGCSLAQQPIEPESRAKPGEIAPAALPYYRARTCLASSIPMPAKLLTARRTACRLCPVPRASPNKPEACRIPGGGVPLVAATRPRRTFQIGPTARNAAPDPALTWGYHPPASHEIPNEPQAPRKPGENAAAPRANECMARPSSAGM